MWLLDNLPFLKQEENDSFEQEWSRPVPNQEPELPKRAFDKPSHGDGTFAISGGAQKNGQAGKINHDAFVLWEYPQDKIKIKAVFDGTPQDNGQGAIEAKELLADFVAKHPLPKTTEIASAYVTKAFLWVQHHLTPGFKTTMTLSLEIPGKIVTGTIGNALSILEKKFYDGSSYLELTDGLGIGFLNFFPPYIKKDLEDIFFHIGSNQKQLTQEIISYYETLIKSDPDCFQTILNSLNYPSKDPNLTHSDKLYKKLRKKPKFDLKIKAHQITPKMAAETAHRFSYFINQEIKIIQNQGLNQELLPSITVQDTYPGCLHILTSDALNKIPAKQFQGILAQARQRYPQNFSIQSRFIAYWLLDLAKAGDDATIIVSLNRQNHSFQPQSRQSLSEANLTFWENQSVLEPDEEEDQELNEAPFEEEEMIEESFQNSDNLYNQNKQKEIKHKPVAATKDRRYYRKGKSIRNTPSTVKTQRPLKQKQDTRVFESNPLFESETEEFDPAENYTMEEAINSARKKTIPINYTPNEPTYQAEARKIRGRSIQDYSKSQENPLPTKLIGSFINGGKVAL